MSGPPLDLFDSIAQMIQKCPLAEHAGFQERVLLYGIGYAFAEP